METIQGLYERVAADLDLKPKQVRQVCNKFFEILGDELAVDKNANIKIMNFGVFKVRIREARKGFNNLTKEEIVIPEKRIPTFTFSPKFKDKVDHFG